jgi:hypothetical protein
MTRAALSILLVSLAVLAAEWAYLHHHHLRLMLP